MSIASILKHLAEALWAAGGIGATADLGCEDFAPQYFRSGPAPAPVHPAAPAAGVRGSRRPERRSTPGAPLEGELCCNPCTRRSVR